MTFFSTAALTLLLATSAGIGQAETLNVGMSGGYFPFTFVKLDKLQGFEVDFLNAIAAETGDEVNFITMSFSGLIGALDSGRIDTIANQITITPEREAKFVFSQPYVIDGAQIVVKSGNGGKISSAADLSGKKVAVNLGSNFEELLLALPNAKDIKVLTYESNIAQETALGRVDAFVMDRVSSAQLIKESPLPLELAGTPFSEIRNALPFADTEKGRALRDKVDAAITTLRGNGKLAEISVKWFGIDITVVK
jgi:putative amino-acid transport system substrate-binding protein